MAACTPRSPPPPRPPPRTTPHPPPPPQPPQPRPPPPAPPPTPPPGTSRHPGGPAGQSPRRHPTILADWYTAPAPLEVRLAPMPGRIPCSVNMLTRNSAETLVRALESVSEFAEIVV